MCAFSQKAKIVAAVTYCVTLGTRRTFNFAIISLLTLKKLSTKNKTKAKKVQLLCIQDIYWLCYVLTVGRFKLVLSKTPELTNIQKQGQQLKLCHK